jgi:mercuric ion transport protein
MSDDVKSIVAQRPRLSRLRAFGPVALAASGVAAAFGAASCCAIPMLLGGLGLGSLGSAVFMPILGPYQHDLLGAATVCLLASGGFLWRRDLCACQATRMTTAATLIGLMLGGALLALGLAYG